MKDSKRSKNTVDKTMQSLRDKNKILNTGEKKGKRHNIPVYKITISNNPSSRGDSSLTTPISLDTTPVDGVINNPSSRDIERYIKDLKKEDLLSFLKTANQPQKQVIGYLRNNLEKHMTKEEYELLRTLFE